MSITVELGLKSTGTNTNFFSGMRKIFYIHHGTGLISFTFHIKPHNAHTCKYRPHPLPTKATKTSLLYSYLLFDFHGVMLFNALVQKNIWKAHEKVKGILWPALQLLLFARSTELYICTVPPLQGNRSREYRTKEFKNDITKRNTLYQRWTQKCPTRPERN